jgi:predicted PurR-regulated permease PerM
MPLELTDRQQSTVASAITILAALVILIAIAGVFVLIGAFFNRFSNVFLPLAVAGVAALVCKPYYEWLRVTVRLGRIIALVAVFLSAIVPIGAFLWFFGALLADQVRDLVDKLPELWRSVESWVRQHAPQVVDFLQRNQLIAGLRGAVEGQEGTLVESLRAVGRGAWSAGRDVASGVAGLLGWVVLPVYFSFFLISERKGVFDLEKHLPFLKPETRKDVAYLVKEFVDIVVAFFRGQLIVAFLQGLLFAIGFVLVGLKYGFVIGLVLGFLNIIPYLGSIIGLASALPLAFFQPGGGLVKVALVLVVFTVVQLIEGYLLTPKIMGDRTGLHPMAIIVAIFFWGSALGGIMGMILAIPLTAFLVVFWRLANEKYLGELV